MTPILLIPGLMCTAELYAAQVPALWAHGPVTVANTLGCQTIGEMAAAILRDAPPRFALGGVSMGGYLSFEILRQAPERVVKLALIDTTARPDTPEGAERRRRMIAMAGSGGLEGFLPGLELIVPALLHPDHAGDRELFAVFARMAAVVGVEGFQNQQRAMLGRPDSRPMLGRINVPTPVLVGEGDQMTPLPHAQEIAEAIPGAKLVVVQNAGHSPTLEEPEAVNRALVEWIQR